MEGMRVGGQRELIIPSGLGYGKQGAGPIGPNQDLVFHVELLDVSGR
jgi:FKBP-type peptidyl-prolyl cis-trans isomerase